MSEATAGTCLLVQMLAWIDARPRTYSDSMEAWRSSCPRHPVWDDALLEGLIRIDYARPTGMSVAAVVLTDAGRARLESYTTDAKPIGN